MTAIRFAETCFRWIVHAYPAHFRRQHGLALFELFRDDVRAAAGRGGTPAIARVLIAAAWDTLLAAPATWLQRQRVAQPERRRHVQLSGWGSDVRVALRQLRHFPGFVVVAALMLAAGIGANLTVFNLANAVLLRPLALTDPNRVVRLTARTDSGLTTNRFTFAEFQALKANGAAFEELAALTQEACIVSADGRREEILAEIVSGSYLSTLGARALAGRVVAANDDVAGADPVVAISETLWRRRFAADRAVIGRTLVIDGVPRTIVGIVAGTFNGSFVAAPIDAWIPLSTSTAEIGPNWQTDVSRRRFVIIGRLQPGVSLARAAADVQFVTALAQIPVALRINRLDIIPGTLVFGQQRQLAQMFLGLVLGLVGLVLFVVCANVANLMLARLLGRRRELAIRTALGASRVQLIRLLAFESITIALLGAAGALVAAQWTTSLLTSIQPLPTVSLRIDTHLDWRVFAFTALVAVIASIVLIVAGAIQIASPQLRPALSEDSGGSIGQRSTSRLRGALVIVQVAVSLVLLVGATLFSRSVRYAEQIDLGFDPRDVVVLDVDRRGQPDPPAARGFFDRVIRDLAADPAVEAAAVATRAPLDSSTPITHFDASGPIAATPGAKLPIASFLIVSPAYFDVVRTPILAGRAFRVEDTAAAPPVAIVNETLAQRAWPGESPIGKRLWLDGHAALAPCIVVGVARNSRYVTLGEEGQAHVYVPFAQQPRTSMAVLVRSRQPVDRTVARIQDALSAAAPGVQGFFARTLAQHASVSLLPVRLAAQLASVIAILGSALATVGLYALVSFMVSERTQEIGLRMALGATPSSLIRLVVGAGLTLVGVGSIVGILLAAAGSRLLRSLLYGVNPMDATSFVGVSVFVLALGALACAGPALRIVRLDPLAALRRS